jgi:cell division protein FtsI (penicillin-binding protein 3)
LSGEVHVRVTDRDLAERVRLERMRVRLLATAAGFSGLFGLVAVKLALATVLMPAAVPERDISPLVPVVAAPVGLDGPSLNAAMMPLTRRATITDRNGQILAISLPLANVYADPRVIVDAHAVAEKLRGVLPTLDVDATVHRLSAAKRFVYLAREITPDQEMAINDLGIPGIEFEPGEKRRYPLGRTAAQVMGAVDIDDHGVAGVERFFDRRLTTSTEPLRLSIDVRVQAVVRDEVQKSIDNFKALDGCGIVMDVRTGEILAMVSLPDYDANDFGKADPNARFNRAVTGMYEPGSTFKLQTAAMALSDGVAHVWDRFSSRPIHVGRFTISDMKTDHFAPWLTLAETIAYSSNPAAAHIALDVGATRQQDWLRNMGFFKRTPVELPESAFPIIPSVKNWGESTIMTVAFGHGVAEPPLSIVRGTAATANGGVLVTPTLQARPEGEAEPDGPVGGTRLMSEETSTTLRKLLRLVVTKGTVSKVKEADVPGYFLGGKTGTAEKIGPHGGYLKHQNISAFTSVFPMNAPRYAVYVMLDNPQATKETHGWTTAAWNAAPTAARVIARAAPMLGLFPVTDQAAADAVQASIDMPLQPGAPSGARTLGPGNDPGDPGEGRVSSPHKAHKGGGREVVASLAPPLDERADATR